MTQLETVLEQLLREIDNQGRRIESLEAHENNYFSRLTIGSPVASPGTGDAVIDNDLTVEGTITGTGLVTGGDSHDHDGGDGAQIPTAGIANDAIDDTKAGNRVPQFYRRKGGSASNWASPGSSNYTPGAVRMQGGSVAVSPSSTNVTFPTSFSNSPLVFLSQSSRYDPKDLYITSVSSSSFTITTDLSTEVHWLAIGPE